MSNERFKRLQELFHEALERAADDRDAWLDRECAGDATLRREVRRLLAQDQRSSDPLERGVWAALRSGRHDNDRGLSPPVNRRDEDSAANDGQGDSRICRPSDSGQGIEPRRIGRYQLLQRLGVGGCGTVFLAVDDELDRKVAVKVPHSGSPLSVEQIECFRREARVLAGLDHPGLVPVYDFGQTEDGECFVVSKFIDGGDLQQLIQRRIPWAESARIIARITDALHYIHTRGIIHRDIKPTNLLIDRDGNPFVADFGLVVQEAIQQCHRGEIAGTLEYMAPEQLRGESHLMDGRADIWSLGAVLYLLLSGRPPFHSTSPTQLCEEILFREPKPPRMINDDIPVELERITLKCLTRQITGRYSTAKDLGEDLRRWLHDVRPGSPSPNRRVDLPPVSNGRPEKTAFGGIRRSTVLLMITVPLAALTWNIFTKTPLVRPGHEQTAVVPIVEQPAHGTFAPSGEELQVASPESETANNHPSRGPGNDPLHDTFDEDFTDVNQGGIPLGWKAAPISFEKHDDGGASYLTVSKDGMQLIKLPERTVPMLANDFTLEIRFWIPSGEKKENSFEVVFDTSRESIPIGVRIYRSRILVMNVSCPEDMVWTDFVSRQRTNPATMRLRREGNVLKVFLLELNSGRETLFGQVALAAESRITGLSIGLMGSGVRGQRNESATLQSVRILPAPSVASHAVANDAVNGNTRKQ